jgi:hypothetical protein
MCPFQEHFSGTIIGIRKVANIYLAHYQYLYCSIDQ